jgi:SAM-dependent methyltransferase
VSHVFGEEYSDAYDHLYHDKDYALECELVAQALERAGCPRQSKILDLGCGTGAHALLLAEYGHQVTGVDRSPHMLERAKEKAVAHGANNGRELSLNWVRGDICHLNLGETFDAVLMLFAVLGYQHTNQDVLAALKSARRHLKPDGLLFFDIWYGPAVLVQKPGTREKTVPAKTGHLVRKTSSANHTSSHLCDVEFELHHMKGEEIISQSREVHRMRYFFPQELNLFLEISGFSSAQITAFPSLDTPADETTWNVFCAAKAKA